VLLRHRKRGTRRRRLGAGSCRLRFPLLLAQSGRYLDGRWRPRRVGDVLSLGVCCVQEFPLGVGESRAETDELGGFSLDGRWSSGVAALVVLGESSCRKVLEVKLLGLHVVRGADGQTRQVPLRHGLGAQQRELPHTRQVEQRPTAQGLQDAGCWRCGAEARDSFDCFRRQLEGERQTGEAAATTSPWGRLVRTIRQRWKDVELRVRRCHLRLGRWVASGEPRRRRVRAFVHPAA